MTKMGEPIFVREDLQETAIRLTRNFTSNSLESSLELFSIIDLSDTFPTTTFTGLDHDRPTNLLCLDQSFLPRVNASLLVRLVWYSDVSLGRENSIGDSSTGPRHTWHFGVLSDNGGRDLVSEGSHGGTWGTDKDDFRFGKRFR
jgi:hypothetical protein